MEVFQSSPDEIFRMFRHPNMIGRDMIGDKIEDQPDVPFGEPASGFCQPLGAAEVRVDVIAANTVR